MNIRFGRNKMNANTHTSTGDPRGYIDPSELRELWFHTGTKCNLNCPFCFERSSPDSSRIDPLSFDDAKPLIDEAMAMNVQRFGFTGGEPFVNKDFIRLITYATERAPTLVLTNGTQPLINNFAKLAKLLKAPYPLSFRISIDSPNADEHDENRGAGSFDKALKSLKMLHSAGFAISVAGRREDRGNEYSTMFANVAVPENTPVVFFPELEETDDVPEITENCMTTYKDTETRAEFMCAYSKMALTKNGKIAIYACTLVDDDDFYDLGSTLEEAMSKRVILKHKRCFSCFSSGVSCGG